MERADTSPTARPPGPVALIGALAIAGLIVAYLVTKDLRIGGVFLIAAGLFCLVRIHQAGTKDFREASGPYAWPALMLPHLSEGAGRVFVAALSAVAFAFGIFAVIHG